MRLVSSWSAVSAGVNTFENNFQIFVLISYISILNIKHHLSSYNNGKSIGEAITLLEIGANAQANKKVLGWTVWDAL